ncbi:MAG TPA: hypothetical protein VI306_05855 [Pyrinomonadaceae bacterium]
MPIRITEIEVNSPSSSDSAESGEVKPRTFKVEGTLHLKDAELLEDICRDVSNRPLIIELSDICFVDGPSARVLCRMKREAGIEIKGMNLFIKKVMEIEDRCTGEERAV